MTFDCSRFSFNSWNDYLGVVMQQGRVQLDSDWNEWLSELGRRTRAGTMDTVGRAVYPATTPYGFKINAFLDSGNQQHVSIGVGRMYVDGLLVENHGPSASAPWDPALAELSWTAQGASEVDVDFTQQPYYPGATLPTGNGPFLAYLDVWQRPVSFLIDPALVETAVGVDTTGRLQTVWQVKLLDVSLVSGGVTCSTQDKDIPPWQALIQPSAARLTTRVVPSSQTGPCAIAPTTGYTGQENQLYRVQIHQGGTANASGTVATPSATFKWSRDNASVITAVTAINPATSSTQANVSQLTVQSTGRDQVLGFQPGDWIEITDDFMELNGTAQGGPTGELHQIDTNGVDKTARTITLVTQVSAGLGTRLGSSTNYHTRICRWDMNAASGKVLLSDGVTQWVDLSVAGTGQIPVPPPGTALILENGVTVAFDLNPATGSFLAGDFWTFPARTADGSAGPLTEAPPMGIHHHYARLAVVTFPTSAPDCRIQWPPEQDGGCCCMVMIAPADITATNSLQNVLDKYQNQRNETVVCLMPGAYPLNAPLRLTAAHANMTLTACPPGSAVLSAVNGSEGQFGDGLVVLNNTSNTTLRGLRFNIPALRFIPANGQFANQAVGSYDPDIQTIIDELVVSIGVRPYNCTSLTIEDCQFTFVPKEIQGRQIPFGVGVFAGGQCANWRLAKNTFAGTRAFMAGLVLTPSVAFASPAAELTVAPAQTGTTVAGVNNAVAEATAPQSTASRSRATATPAVSLPPGIEQVTAAATAVTTAATGLGQLEAILATGSSSPIQAASGGIVTPSSLDDAVIQENSFTKLTIAVLVVAEAGTVRVTGNEVTNCQAGVWIIAPTEAAFLSFTSVGIEIMVGSSVAFGYPPPQGATAGSMTVASAPAAIRIYTGAQRYTDRLGDIWTPDDFASTTFQISGTSALSRPVPPPTIFNALPTNTDQALYESERWGNFTYTFTNLPEGFYQVTLKLAEIFWDAPSQRLIDVSINGVQVLRNFDIFQDAGGQNRADDQVFANIASSAGDITIAFSAAPSSQDHNAKVSAIEIESQWSSDFVSTTLLTGTEIQNFCAQITVLAEQGFAGMTAMPPALRIDANEMGGLTSSGILLLGDDAVQNGHISSLMMSGNRLAGVVPQMAVAKLDDISRCVVSGNTILNLETKPDYRVSLELDDRTVPTPQIAVAGNLLQGLRKIFPSRYPDDSTLTYPMNSWDFLNTIS
jgi:hypothetical protein